MDAKIHIRRNVSDTLFYGIRTGPTQAWKIVRRRFTPQTHRNALRDPQIPLDTKTHVRRNVSRRTCSSNCAFPNEDKK
jgi:hypothetical protein